MTFLFTEREGEQGEQRLVVEGELDLAGAPKVEEWAGRVLDAGAKHLVLDLSQTTFIDSTAVRAMLRAHDLAHEAGGSFVVVAENRSVLRVFEIAGIDKKLAIKRPPPHPAIAKGLKAR
jgi:anti-sigma B factor antagonist